VSPLSAWPYFRLIELSIRRPSVSTTRLPDLRFHQLAPLCDGGGDLGHLQRRGQEPLLADRDAGDSIGSSLVTTSPVSMSTMPLSSAVGGRSIAGFC